METRKNFNTPKVPRTTEVFPQAVITAHFIFLSGTAGFNPSTGKLSDSFEEQALPKLAKVYVSHCIKAAYLDTLLGWPLSSPFP